MNRSGRCTVPGLFVCLWFAQLTCTHAALPANDYSRFHRLGVEQGLPTGNVTALLQDRTGFLWIGTQSGLYRYDGYRFLEYHSAAQAGLGLSDGWVWSLHEDPDGLLWVGTQDGVLHRFDPRLQRFSLFRPIGSVQSASGGNELRAIASTDTALWLGTRHGLIGLDRRTAQPLPVQPSHAEQSELLAESVTALCNDGPHSIWVAGARRLLRIDRAGRIDRRIEPTEADAQDRISALHCGADRTLWIGWEDGRLQRVSADGGTPVDLPMPPQGIGTVTAVVGDAEGRTWVGSFESGLWRLDLGANSWRQLPARPQDPHGLAANRISVLMTDRSGGLWVGTWNRGLHRLDLVSGGLNAWRAGDGSGDWPVYSIVGDGGQGMWLGTVGAGVLHVDVPNGEVSAFRHDPADASSLGHDVVRVVYRDRAGSLWIGHHLGMDRLLADGSFQHFRHDGSPNGLGEGPVRSLLEDRAGRFWVGGESFGLILFDRDGGPSKRFTERPEDPGSLSHDWVQALLEDNRGRVWIGTRRGLNRWREDRSGFDRWLHDPAQPDSLGHDRVVCLFEDSRQWLWLCTGGGLHRVHEDASGRLRFQVYGRSQGLAAEAIGAILEAPDGRLWFSTTAGLSSLQPESGQIRNYGARDGALSDGYFVNSAYASPDRRQLYFGGARGLTRLLPSAMRDNPYPPAVVLTDLLLFNHPVQISADDRDGLLKQAIESTASLELDHRQGVFGFEFAALHFADPVRNRFAYRLEGFDPDWQETDASRRYAGYTNLPAGQYRFRVRASNKDGVWNEQGTSIDVHVLAPPWRTPWAYLAYALALGLLGGRWYWKRQKRLQTERRYLRAVSASEARLKLALWGSGDALWDWDVANDTVHRAGLEFLGYAADELQPRFAALVDLIHPDDRANAVERIECLRQGKASDYSAEFRVRTRDGRWLWILDRGKVVETDPEGRVTRIAGTMKNDQARKETEQALLQLAKFDPLTGLPNRAMFQERLHAALSQARRQERGLALLFVDIDHFKHVNDSLGHASGDALLWAVGQRLRHSLREGDLVARLGGDEFTVMLEGIQSANEVAALASHLLQAFAQPLQMEGRELTVGMSIGISLYPHDGEDSDTLLQHADTAMYSAKNRGRNGFQFYTAEMNETAVRRLAIESGLRQAIQRGELSLVFQPRMDLVSGCFVGAETLLRWRSAELGAVSPSEFIPVAEDSGQIHALGEWVLRGACAQYQGWRGDGLAGFALSVNVSGLQLMRAGLVAMVARVLRESGMPPEYLELEITETALMNNAARAIDVLRRLKSLGVKIAIDDFGIGYSSLSYLKRFPIDLIKIDQSFVLDIEHDPDAATIVSAIIAMAHALDHLVVAEGVEGAEQLALLRYQGCDQVQGFHYSLPLALDDFGAFLRKQGDPIALTSSTHRPL